MTTRLDVTSDDDENSIGYLGRAHPLVRRAIDRVRMISIGTNAKFTQDQRVSAVKADVSEPQLLFTFLGRVSSSAGREFEKVLAVRIMEKGKPVFFESADDWSGHADPALAIRTTDLWKKHFASWGPKAQEKSLSTAASGFQPIGEQFTDERKKALQREFVNVEDWLKKRAEEVTGTSVAPASIQKTLFDAGEAVPDVPAAAWHTIKDPGKRLAAFHSDRQQSATARAEAEGVLRIHEQRCGLLIRLLDLRKPEIIPLGVLMLIPEAKHGA